MGEILAQHTPDEELQFQHNADPRQDRRVPARDICRYFASPVTVAQLFGNDESDEAAGSEVFTRSAH